MYDAVKCRIYSRILPKSSEAKGAHQEVCKVYLENGAPIML
jgi:hypothetical protein